MSIKTTAVELLRARRRAHWAAPRNRAPLTAAEKSEVEMLWGGVWSKPSFEWHEHYKAVNGEFDPRYMPSDVFYLDLLPRLSNLTLADAWEDKSYYSKRFPGAPFPKLHFACIGGRLVDGALAYTTWGGAYEAIRGQDAVFVKPSLGSCQGLGAFKLELSDVDGPGRLKERLASSGENYVVQGLIEQTDLMSDFNSSSVNIIRMNTLCLDGDAFLANATIRFGVAGKVTDVSYIDGIETARVAGLDDGGRLRGFYCDQDGKRYDLSGLGILGDAIVPGFEKAVDCCLDLHKQMHHFGIAAFDVAIGKNDEPVIVEVNLDGPGSVFYQYANGPFFGNHTENVIEWCKAQAWKPNVRMQMI